MGSKSLFRKHMQSIFSAILYGTSLVISITVVGQNKFIFTPSLDDEQHLKSLSATFEKRYHAEIGKISSDNKKDILELYKRQWEGVKERFDNKEIYTSTFAQDYLDALVNEIKSKNPVLHSLSFNTFFSRSGIPNASYIGEGVIVFHMGLFNKLQNESQAAFILCHEIAHFYLQHTQRSIINSVAMLNSEEVKKGLKKIKNTEYNKRSQLDMLLKGFAYNSSRHSRDHETQADSMALEFMRHTLFDIRESLTALDLLDSIDVDTFETNSCLEKYFNVKEYPFQKKWIAKPKSLFADAAISEPDKEITDSLKTHPDCQVRIKMLENRVKEFQHSNIKNLINESIFNELKTTFDYEVVEFSFATGHYSKSLYYALQLLDAHSNDPYLITHIGKIFNGLYIAQKNHVLSRVADLPSPYIFPSYNQLLQFIQNLYVNDLAQVNYNFLKSYSSSLEHYTPFKDVYNTSMQISENIIQH